VHRFNCLNLVDNDVFGKQNYCGSNRKEKINIPINDVISSLSVSFDHDGPLNPSDVCSVPNWVKLGGWEYLPGGIIVLKKSYETESSLPKFAVILNIIAKTEFKIFLVLSVLKTISFHTKYHSYLVEEKTHEKT
jgi:hypothetical protein